MIMGQGRGGNNAQGSRIQYNITEHITNNKENKDCENKLVLIANLSISSLQS